jgi:hypothetical protein
MAAPIIMHRKWEDDYDDPTHPIPSLTSLDIQAVKIGGGSDLVIVVASPLQSDEKSQRRLLSKIGIYLSFLSTPEFEASSGVATPQNTSIIVQLHPASDNVIFELIDRCKPWVLSKNASLQVKILELS